MKTKIKVLLFLICTTIGTITFTGCGGALGTYFTSDFPKALDVRRQQNKDIAEKLKNAGFIDKKMYNTI